MNVTVEPIQLRLPQPKTPRTAGTHVSGIIRCIATETGVLKPEWAEELSLVDVREITDRTAIIRICFGLAIEEWYIPQMQDVVDHPGEMCVNGIYLTHDAESLDVIITPVKRVHRLKIHEVKCTWKSINTVKQMNAEIRSNWMWLAQTKAYCFAAGTNLCDLHVFYACGNYKFPISPEALVYHMEFTDQELKDNWNLLVDYRDHRLTIEGA